MLLTQDYGMWKRMKIEKYWLRRGFLPGGRGEYKVSVSRTNSNWTLFLSSKDMALASLRKTALPHRSSLRLVN